MKAADRKDQVIAEQKQQIAKLKKLNGELRAKLEKTLQRNAELEAKLAQNSTNSSKPPSSDPPSTEKKKPSKPRKPGKRKRGGQPGHERHERKLLPESEVSEVTTVKPTHCRKCEKRLKGNDSHPYGHQVVEIPPIQPTVNEWQLHCLACEHCGTTTRAQRKLSTKLRHLFNEIREGMLAPAECSRRRVVTSTPAAKSSAKPLHRQLHQLPTSPPEDS